MKRKLLALLTAGMLLASGTGVHANVYSERQERIADALYHVELFKGTNLGYELGRELNRVEGITLLVRMLGQEDAAMSKTYNLPFTDVADWAKPYVGYAYENGITNGISATEFGSATTMTDYMFITLTLRALGYTDKGEAPQFVWNAPYILAKSAGLIDVPEADTFFSRGDAIEVFWNALSRNDYEMAYSLKDRGVFTADELEDAIDIYLYGKKEDTSSSVVKNETSDSSDIGENFDRELPLISKEEDTSDSDDRKDKEDKPSNPDNGGGLELPSTSESETPEAPDDTEKDNENETPKVPYEPGKVTYQDYIGMSGAEQQAYFESFANPADFFTWFNTGKAEYEAQNPSIEIGADGVIDLGDLIGKENNGGR